jgi:hypothetical protein
MVDCTFVNVHIDLLELQQYTFSRIFLDINMLESCCRYGPPPTLCNYRNSPGAGTPNLSLERAPVTFFRSRMQVL